MKKTISLITMLLALAFQAATAQTVTVDNVDVSQGSENTLSVHLKNAGNCVASGFTLSLPEGSLNNSGSTAGYSLELGNDVAQDHVVVYEQVSANELKVAVYSLTNSAFKSGGSGDVLLTVKFLGAGCKTGSYKGYLRNVELATSSKQLVTRSDVTFNVNVGGGSDSNEAYAWLSTDGKKLTFCYDKQKTSRAGTTYDLNTGSNSPGWYDKRSGVTSVVFTSAFSSARPTSCYRWFCGMTSLASITDLKYLNTSEVTNMMSMFNACGNLTSIDLSGFNTDKVTNLSYLFYKCSKLTGIDVSKLSTSKATTMKSMFSTCSSLASLNISGFTLTSSQETANMMLGCSALKTLTVPSTANTLDATACTNVGTKTAPCALVHSSGFTPQKDATGSGWYQWKSGYFTDAVEAGEAYAWLSSDGKTLTFCYDGQKSVRSGTTYAMNTGSNSPGWYSQREGVTGVVFNPDFSSATPTSCYRWFCGMTNLAGITGLEYLNTSKVTNMMSMFNACSSLSAIDLSTFNTEQVTNMSYMFYKCSKLTDIDASVFSTAKVTTMKSMFSTCPSLTSLNISGFKVTSSQETANMMLDCSALKTLVVSSTANNLDATACTNIGTQAAPCILAYPSGFTPQKDATGTGWYQWKTGYFKDAPVEIYVWLSSDGKKLTFCRDKYKAARAGTTYALNTGSNSPGWYNKCDEVTTVVFNSAFSSARPTSCYRWFCGMTNLASITNLKYLNTSQVTNMMSMFNACSSLTAIDLSTFNTELVTNMSYMFYKCSSLTDIDASVFSTASVTTMKSMFSTCSSLTSLNISGFTLTSSQETANMMLGCSALKTLTIPSTANNLDAAACTNVGTKTAPCTLDHPSDFKPKKTSSGTGWYQWRAGYFTDASIEPYAWLSSDGKKLTFCYDNRRAVRSGTTYDLNTGSNSPGWYSQREGVTGVVFNPDFSSASPTSCYRWFCGMTSLAGITDLKYLNTSQVTNMMSMFNACSSLTAIDLSTFNTEQVTNMSYMFYKCSGLTGIDVSPLSTASVTTMKSMFSTCSSLTSLDISGFTLTSSQETANMMSGCSALKTLTVPSTANRLDATACTNIGKQAAPCTLDHPSGFKPQKDATGTGWYQWKTGYFTDTPTAPYAWLSSDGKTLTFCYDNLRGVRSGTTYALNTESNSPGWYSQREGVTSVVFTPTFSSASPTSCFRWFCGMTNLAGITGLEYLNTSQVTNMMSMFNACSSLTAIDLSTFNTEQVTNMSYMFYKCSGLTGIDASAFSIVNVTTMKSMFSTCSSLTSLNISGFTLTSSQETVNMMSGCSALKTLAVPSTANTLDATACANVGTQADPCILAYPSGFTPQKDATGSGWYQWKTGYFTDSPTETYAWLSSDGKKLTFCRDKYKAIRVGTTYALNTGSNSPGWYSQREGVTSVVFNSAFSSARPTSCYRWFCGMTNLASITNLKYLNTSKVTNMMSMFNACSNLTSVDLSTFSTELVTNMSYMFYKCSKLTGIDASMFSTASVTTMKSMFSTCPSLTSLDISGFTLMSSQETANMMLGCSALKMLFIPSTANSLDATACTNVGTKTAPCSLVHPSNFTPQKTASGTGWYQWKTGYFKSVTGDANGYGEVTISDVQMAMDYVLGKNPADIVLANTEVTCDGEITISDVSAIAGIVLKSPSAIAARAHESMTDMIALTAKGNSCTVHLSASAPYHAFQMTIVLPESGRMGNMRLADSRANGHRADWNEVAPSRYNVVCWSSTGEALREGPTALLHFDIIGCDAADVLIENVQMVDSWCETVLLPSITGLTTGVAWIVDDGSDTQSPFYNTVGIGSSTPQRGVNIKDARKVVVK